MKTADEPVTTLKSYYIVYNKENNFEPTKVTTVDFEETIVKLYDLMSQQSYYGDQNYY
jgi:hypothetical protein